MTIEDKVIQEANNYFLRNKKTGSRSGSPSKGTYIAREFLGRYLSEFPGRINKILEIGCCYGYNLNFLSNELDVYCYGIEPSDQAIKYGEQMFCRGVTSKIYMQQGISNCLPYHDEEFDVVMIGFSLYVTPRELVADTISEINRVLRQGGFIVLTDFDTPIKCRRVNIHNEEMYVYKENYAEPFLSMGYSLVEKRSYSHAGDSFNPDIQERVSTQILYKEIHEELYFDA